MAAVDPVSVGFAALYAILTGDATFMGYVPGGVVQLNAPPQTTADYCNLINQSATDVKSATGVRIMTTLLYQVKIMGPEQDASNLRNAFARADALLQPNQAPLRNYGGTLAIYRESLLPTDGGVINGQQWLCAGALYRVEV